MPLTPAKQTFQRTYVPSANSPDRWEAILGAVSVNRAERCRRERVADPSDRVFFRSLELGKLDRASRRRPSRLVLIASSLNSIGLITAKHGNISARTSADVTLSWGESSGTLLAREGSCSCGPRFLQVSGAWKVGSRLQTSAIANRTDRKFSNCHASNAFSIENQAQTPPTTTRLPLAIPTLLRKIKHFRNQVNNDEDND
ncbi:hypothetical protein BDK51DRAFT_44049 [Blyttiomyces helicus]|uniref:Uncharacterized protein n=1 Tax=Blyttiomyces helicus TaxID=388810 RepID=A0A4P9WQP4_9FUNG|nr:hypothetical protein BDK51DRAFT_44049 [Blyttiomyces helicus]|eukprot:RKO93540.1 hypothetical protein BDK51DRAFT_44049 [Blyttiomyces helicus]